MLNPITLPGWNDAVDLAPHHPLSYDQALREQARQYQRRDRVHCVACLMGRTHVACRCKYVDKRGQLAGVDSPIYFFPDGPATPGHRCRVNILGKDLFVTRPCQYRIRELNPSPWNGARPCTSVWIRCDVRTCTGQACFPCGLGIRGGATEWVEVRRVAHLLNPYIDSVRKRIRILGNLRAAGQTKQDIPDLLMDLYGVGGLLNLRNTCKELAKESSLRILLEVRNP